MLASDDKNLRPDAQYPHDDNVAEIFRRLEFRHLAVKNRLFRSNLSGTFDDYSGHGSNARLNWEEKFARGGVGAIISSFTPVAVRGRILTRYAMIDDDNKIPFWRAVGERVHRYDCRYILQLSHSGRQQDIGGVENLYKKGLSSTSWKDFFHGLLAQAMTQEDIDTVVAQFAAGARRAREAGLDGVELHGANGYLLTQFLSSGINDRTDDYGGRWENRARLVLEIVRAIRAEAGHDFHVQMKINGADHNDWLYPWEKSGNTIEETVKICTLLLDGGRGVDAFHVSSGSTFPHPRNLPGELQLEELARWYDGMLSQGVKTHFNYSIFRNSLTGPLFAMLWRLRRGRVIEGINLSYSARIREAVQAIDPSVPVLCTGGFQHASVIAGAIRSGLCDAVTIGRPLIANNDLPEILKTADGPPPGRECTYCNRCLFNDLENPLGCYEVSRFPGATFEEQYGNMIAEIMSVFEPPTFPANAPPTAQEAAPEPAVARERVP